jgi:hypothetical protein
MLANHLKSKGGAMMKKLFASTVLLILMINGCATSSGSKSSDGKMMAAYQELLTKENVKQVVNQLFISTDNRDWDTVSRLFASEVLFDMTSMVGGDPVMLTPQQIVASWEKGLAPLKAIHHQTGNYIVQTHEDEADVFCYGTASHYLPNKSNRNTRIFVGSYEFHLIKNETWQIDRFKFILKYIDGNPDLEGS